MANYPYDEVGTKLDRTFAATLNKNFDEIEDDIRHLVETVGPILDDSFDSAALAAEFEERLNNEIQKLQPDWVEFKQNTTAQLAQTNYKKADVIYVDQQISTMTGGAIKGTYTTYAALEAAYEDGAVGPFLVEEDGNRYIWDVNKLKWESIGPYEPAEIKKGDVTTDKLADAAVNGYKTDFLIKNENLANQKDIKPGGYYSQSGFWVPAEGWNSFIINLLNSGKHITNIGTISNYRSEICFWDKDGKVIKSNITAGSWQDVIDIPDYVKRVSIAFVAGTDMKNAMFVKGEVLPKEYIPYGFYFDEEVIIMSTQQSAECDALLFGESITETATMNEDGTNYRETGRIMWPTFIKKYANIRSIKNYARSGATIKDRYVTNDRRINISEQVKMAISNGETPKIIVLSAGTNDIGSSSVGSFDAAMGIEKLEDLNRGVFYEALRWNLWMIKKNFPEAICFIATPIQRASMEQPEWVSEAIKKMGGRYNFIIIDAMNESGIIREFETVDREGKDLADGLHPNVNGAEKMAKLYGNVMNAYSPLL